MKNVGFFFFVLGEAEPRKAGIRKRAIVIPGLVTGKSGDSFDPDTKKVMREGLKERQCLWRQLAVFRQVLCIADLF